MKKNKKKFLYLKKIKRCPICKSKNLFIISNIKSKIKDIGSKFNLIKCSNCSHRAISKIPKEKFLKNLYMNDSPLVFGGAKILLVSIIHSWRQVAQNILILATIEVDKMENMVL